MQFEFTLLDEPGCVSGKFGQLKLKIHSGDTEYFIIKYFYPRRLDNGWFTISENDDEPYNNNNLEAFIKKIKNGGDCVYCVYSRDSEAIFEYNDGYFRVEPVTYNTVFNFTPEEFDFAVYDQEEVIVSGLTQVHDWLKTLY
jgi:hypothetical protein